MREQYLERFHDLINEIENYDRGLLQECSFILSGKLRDGQTDESCDERENWEAFFGKEYYWVEIEERMEKIMESRVTLTPKGAATIIQRYHKIRPQMLPKLIKMAQRIKHRLHMRAKRAGEVQEGYNQELKNLYRDR
ncbi:MAG: hypothetical protein D6690_05295 [Nitrospirae bacterium]|nr:MAG: hypothetical protein D6690_05295 [Nitrospirota bacterium]